MNLVKREESKGDKTEKKQKGKKWKREAKRVWLEIGSTKCETIATEKCLVVTRLRKLCLVGHTIQGLRFSDKGRDLGGSSQH